MYALRVVEMVPLSVGELLGEVAIAHVGEADGRGSLVLREGSLVLCLELLHVLLGKSRGAHAYCENEGDQEALEGDRAHYDEHPGKQLGMVVCLDGHLFKLLFKFKNLRGLVIFGLNTIIILLMQGKTSAQDPYSKRRKPHNRLDYISKTERRTYTRAQILSRFRYRGLAGAPDGSIPAHLVSKDDQANSVFMRDPRKPENASSVLTEAIESPMVQSGDHRQMAAKAADEWNFRQQRPPESEGWDEEFQKGGKKFELGARVIERSLDSQLAGMKISLQEEINVARIVKTSNIDVFLSCDFMTAEELAEAQSHETPDDDESMPAWAEDVQPQSKPKQDWPAQDEAIISYKKTTTTK